MATRTDAQAIAQHLDGTLRDLFNQMTRAPGGLISLQLELDRFTMGGVPGNRDTARLVALAYVRRRRLAHTGPLRDDAEAYLLAMARGRVPPPTPANAISTAVHIDADPYRDWAGLVRRHDRLSPTMKTALKTGWAATAAVLTRDFAKAILTARNFLSAEFWERFGLQLMGELSKTLVGILAESASNSMLGAVSAPTPQFLDTATQRSHDWAAQYAARLIVDITNSQERTFRSIVARAFEEGYGPEELAWRLRNNGLGLHDRYATAVDNFYKGMIESGVPRGIARERSRLYAAHLRDVRADTIARTETMYALNWGRMELWNAAIQHDDLPSDVGKRWVTALDERVCPICKPMNNQIVGIYENFEIALKPSLAHDKSDLFLPPVHPSCRCTIVLYHPNAKTLPAKVA